MIVPFGQGAEDIQLAAAVHELEAVNPVIAKHGLALSKDDVTALVAGRIEALAVSDRVEFGGGVAKDLVLAFAGSPYVSQTSFVETVLELQELFYEFKNESLEQVADEDLIAKMRSLFDDPSQGDLGYLAEALFEGLGRQVRKEIVTPRRLGFHDRTDADKVEASMDYEDAADPDADRAAANAYTLASSRYDVSRWVDENYAPGWEGSSWLDE
ncbi:MAG TPA: DUF6323 family protein [Coriobacteriia bacterium]|nr:DUF6323 family protein [Coriobacteriia bacterium]